MALLEKITKLVSRYFLLPLVTLYMYLIQNPKSREYYKSAGILDLGDVSINYVNNFSRQISSTTYWMEMYNRVKEAGASLAGCGLAGHDILIPRSPALIKSILVKDASHFDRVGNLLSLKGDYIASKTLLCLQGEDWTKTRAKFEAAFTPSKIRRNFVQVDKLGKELVQYLNREVEKEAQINFGQAALKFTTDVTGSTMLNLDTGSLRTRGPTRFEEILDKLFSSFDNFANWWKPGFIQWFPRIATYFKVTLVDEEIVEFYRNVAQFEMNNEKGRDRNNFVSVVRSTWEELYGNRGLYDSSDHEEEWITANLFGMVLPGYKTTETLIAMCAYVLALHQDVQDKVRDEINATFESNQDDLDFAAVNRMTYIDMVINETLRMYSPIGLVGRVCKKEYPVPDTNLVLKVGDVIIISLYGLHYDEEYHENPEIFDPERFSSGVKNKDFSFLPFTQGPRNCIGSRMAMLETKMALCYVLRNFKLTRPQKLSFP